MSNTHHGEHLDLGQPRKGLPETIHNLHHKLGAVVFLDMQSKTNISKARQLSREFLRPI